MNSAGDVETADAVVTSFDALRERIRQVWAECLGVAIASPDDFFDLGGDSIMAVKMTVRVRDLLGYDVPLRLVFEHSSFDEFCGGIEQSTSTREAEIPRSARNWS